MAGAVVVARAGAVAGAVAVAEEMVAHPLLPLQVTGVGAVVATAEAAVAVAVTVGVEVAATAIELYAICFATTWSARMGLDADKKLFATRSLKCEVGTNCS